MTEDRYAPQKLDIERIQKGLSQMQMKKIQYECDLLRMDVQKLLYVAPHLFNEGVTASNTLVIEEQQKPEITPPEPTEEYSPQDNYENYENCDDYSYYTP